MGFVLAMSLPALVIALFALGMYELARDRRKHGHHGTAMASTGFDILQEALYPSKRYEVEQREHESLMVDKESDGAPPRSHVDLDRGTAHIQLP